MELSGYKFDIERAISAIKKNRYKKVALQIPEGLKRSVFAIVDYLEKKPVQPSLFLQTHVLVPAMLPTTNLKIVV